MDCTIITGYSSGLGKEVARELDKDNDNFIIGVSRSFNPEIYVDYLEVDISRYQYVLSCLSPMQFEEGTRVNVVLCASTLGKGGGLLDSDLRDWEYVLQTNLLGNLAVIKSVLPQMIKTQYGRIVFLAGGGAAYGYPLFSAYALSKVAIVREVENIAIELKDVIDDFSIISLAPGAMQTSMLKQVREAGAEIKTTVDIKEPVEFIKNFLNMDKEKAKSLSGRFIHVRDDLESEDFKNKWLLRRIE